MGLFSKKENCPVCGSEVKGLFLVKIGEQKTLCKECSKQISMDKELLASATPEFIKEHLEYRKKNAEKYAAHNWSVKITAVPGFEMGLDEEGKALYLIHDDLHDNSKNPVVFSFDQLTGYELVRRKKTVDDMENTGEVHLETGTSALGGITYLVSNNSNSTVDHFLLKLTTTDPYWKNITLKITFTYGQLYGLGGFGKDMKEACQLLKCIIRRQPLYYTR